jgi:uncharacterized protein
MKPLVSITALLALIGSSTVFAANLSIPMSFEFLAIDGEKIESNLFNHKSQISLEQGVHKIAIRYHDMIEDSFSDRQTFVKSSPFIVTLTVDGDHQYHLSPAEGEIISKPKAFALAPKILISREDKGRVDFQVMQTDYEESSFVSALFNGKSKREAQGIAARATQAGHPMDPQGEPAPQVDDVTNKKLKNKENGQHAEQMLQYWWLQADEKTRKEFMSWAIKQL